MLIVPKIGDNKGTRANSIITVYMTLNNIVRSTRKTIGPLNFYQRSTRDGGMVSSENSVRNDKRDDKRDDKRGDFEENCTQKMNYLLGPHGGSES